MHARKIISRLAKQQSSIRMLQLVIFTLKE
jgi:hypothetical protein